MYGFTHILTDTVNIFNHTALDFILELFLDGSGAFYVKGKGKIVKFLAPDRDLLGEKYQPQVARLGYPIDIPWYANATHELLHVWYGYYRLRELSPNHAKLLGLDDTPTKQCDWEELQVTTLQLYANIPSLFTRKNKCVRQAVALQKWIAACVKGE